MKRYILFLFLSSLTLQAQAIRFTQQIVTQNLPPGNYSPNAISASLVTVNGTTYTDATAVTSCPSNAPVVLTGTCQATPDINGNIGFWMLPGTYAYWFTLPAGQMVGPFYFAVSGSGGAPAFPNALFITTVSMLPSASANLNQVYMVTDGMSTSDCTVGGGTTRAWCVSNGTSWNAMTSPGGSGTVTSVGLGATGSLFSVTGSPVTGMGTLQLTLEDQNNNTVLAGPTTSGFLPPTFRALVAADLPLFSSSLNGAVPSSGGGTSNFLRADGTWVAPGGSGTVTSLSAGNLSPLFIASVANPTTTPALSFSLSNAAGTSWFGNASGSSGAPSFNTTTFPNALIPAPSASALGGIESITSLSNNWIAYIDTSGVPHQSQPGFSNLSGSAACSQLPALTGDTTTSAGSCATTTSKINGTNFPASTHVISSNGSSQPVAATTHDESVILNCIASSGSGTAYTCSTTPSFTPGTGDRILFKADVASTGSATLNVNSSSAYTIEKQGGGTALVANDLLAGQWCELVLDATPHWQMNCPTGNASSGSSPYTAIVTGNWSSFGASCTSTNTTTQFGGASINITGTSGSANICGVKISASGNFTHIFAIYYNFPLSNYESAEVGFTDGTKVEYCGVGANSSVSSILGSLTATSSTALTSGTYAAAANSNTTWSILSNPIWFKLIDSSGNLECEWSPDGFIWSVVFNDDSSPFLTPSAVYVGTDPRGGTGTTQLSFVSYQ